MSITIVKVLHVAVKNAVSKVNCFELSSTVNGLLISFHVIFFFLGLYFILNLLTAIIYNQFRGYLTVSLVSSCFSSKLNSEHRDQGKKRM